MNSPSATSTDAGRPNQPPPIPGPPFPFAVLIAVWVLVVVTVTLVTFILPESFVGVARIKIYSDSVANLNALGTNAAHDPYLIQTEFEVMRSQVVLSYVVHDLDLNRVWGNRYNAGNGLLRTSECLGLLKSRIDFRVVRNTTIVEICAYSERPDEAAKLANAVADAYQRHRQQQFQTRAAASGNAPEQANFGVDIIDRAIPNPRPFVPEKPLNVGIGFIVGGLAGAFLAMLLHLIQRRSPRNA